MMKHASVLMIAALCGGFAVASAQDVEVETDDGTPQPHQVYINGNMGSLMINCCGGSFLGIVGSEVTDELVQKLKLPGEYGAIITEVVTGSAAEKAGLQKEDVVVGYNGTRVESMAQLRRMIAETPAGRNVDLTIIRNGVEQHVKTEISTRKIPGTDGLHLWNNGNMWNFDVQDVLPPDFDERMQEQMEKLEDRLKEFDDMDLSALESDSDNVFFAFPQGQGYVSIPDWSGGEDEDQPMAFPNPRVFTRMLVSDRGRLGATVQSLSPQLARFFKLKEGESGALVSEVHDGEAAEKGGLQAGDVITAVDGESVKTPMDLTRLISKKQGTVELRVIRDGSEKTFQVDLGEKDQGCQMPRNGGRNDFFKAPKSDADLSLYGR